MELIEIIAFGFAEELMTFVMRERGIEWHSSRPANPLTSAVRPHFHRHVGRVVVALAKGAEKGTLIETGPSVLTLVTTPQQFERFLRYFTMAFFNRFGCTQVSMLKVFCYIVEFSILLHLHQHATMASAPQVAVGVIADIVIKTNRGSFVETGGLNWLYQSAKYIINDPQSSVLRAYRTGRFPW